MAEKVSNMKDPATYRDGSIVIPFAGNVPVIIEYGSVKWETNS
jgi:hypothetical protein